jgi:hypothetical protein
MNQLSSCCDRRRFLRTSGVAVALPLLESWFQRTATAKDDAAPKVKRLVTIGTYLGFHTPSWFPEQTGRDYSASPVLKPIDDLRDDFTIFSGLDHRAPNGHKNWKNYLTGKGTPGISLDQIVAKAVGEKTRFESLQVTCGSSGEGRMSFTKEGIALPAIGRPSVLFGHLFHSGEDKARMEYLLDSGGSVLDVVLDEARTLQRQVNARDAAKLDEYFSSVRDVEQKLKKQRAWLNVPTPKVDFKLPEFDPVAPDLSLECESLMYDLMVLALETDSTRVISFLAPGQGQVFTIDGEKLSAGYHGLSHHGNDPDKIAEFNAVGREHVGRFGGFVRQLKERKDPEGRTLLDTTAILYGSGMGNANTHNNSNLPVLVAGGPFKHGSHHAIDRDSSARANVLLGDLFLTLMQSMGLEEDRFANASRNVNDLLL